MMTNAEMAQELALYLKAQEEVAVGRPTKLTVELLGKLAEAISLGLTDEEAAALCDISSDCLTRWRQIPAFCGAIKKAEALRVKKRLERIEKGEVGWQGTAWALERLHPRRFSKPERLPYQAFDVTPRKPIIIVDLPDNGRDRDNDSLDSHTRKLIERKTRENEMAWDAVNVKHPYA